MYSLLVCISANALTAQAAYPSLREINIEQVKRVFSEAEELGAMDSDIAARPVLNNGKLLGYVVLTNEVVAIPGYSGKPISALIGIDLSAHITATTIIYHEEPILVAGIKEQQLQDFVTQYAGKDVDKNIRVGAHNRAGYEGIDGITGATITVMVLNRSIMASAKKVAQQLGLPKLADSEASSAEPLAEEIAEMPAWESNWHARTVDLVILGIALTLLLFILFFQDWLVRRTRLFNNTRNGFLLFTVLFIGYWHSAQLSIVNILAFARMIANDFTWYTLLIDPLMFMLWGFIAIASLLWGGGVFCGWLCPFGALQELIHKVAEKLHLPKFEFPPMVHERLLSIKYLILIALVGLSLESMVLVSRLAEVEPFKTTFIFQFQRSPGFVFYAGGLLLIAAFNSKFYCKYLCPLGAALSFITRFRVFDWLRRRKECGRPCQACAAACQMKAIKPTGEIISAECQYCLDCQVVYWDEHRCPPLAEKYNRRQRRTKKHLASSEIDEIKVQEVTIGTAQVTQSNHQKGEQT